MNKLGIEEKLEKDNQTIKDQIANLQNTIKQLKKDMHNTNDSKINKSTFNINSSNEILSTTSLSNTNTYSNTINNTNKKKEQINSNINDNNKNLGMKFSFNSYMFEQNKINTEKKYDNKAFDEKLELMIKKNKDENEKNKNISPFNNNSNTNNYKEENYDNEGEMNFIRSGCSYDENNQEKINESLKEDKKIGNNKEDYFKRDYEVINNINFDGDLNNGTFGHKNIDENNKNLIPSYNSQLNQNKTDNNNIYQSKANKINMNYDNNIFINNNETNRNIDNNKLYSCNTINDSYDIDSMIINKMNNLLSTRRSNNNTISQCLNIIDNEDKKYINTLYNKNNNNTQNNIYIERKIDNKNFEKYNGNGENNNIIKKEQYFLENNNYNGDELNSNDLLRESNKNKDQINSKFKNFVDEDDYSESSLEQKIKKLQNKTFGQKDIMENEFNNYLENNEDSFIENSRMTYKKGNIISNSSSIKSSFNSDKKLNRFKCLKKGNKSKSSSKLIRINKNSSSISKKKINSRNNSIRSNGNHKNHLCTENNINYNYNIRKYQNEIIQLKNIINKLKIENEKLKKSLKEERKQNKKFKQLTEEIIKHYEKNKY